MHISANARVSETLPDAPDDRYLAGAVEQALRTLRVTDAALLRLRYGFSGRRYSPREAARVLGMEVGALRRVEQNILRLLRHHAVFGAARQSRSASTRLK